MNLENTYYVEDTGLFRVSLEIPGQFKRAVRNKDNAFGGKSDDHSISPSRLPIPAQFMLLSNEIPAKSR